MSQKSESTAAEKQSASRVLVFDDVPTAKDASSSKPLNIKNVSETSSSDGRDQVHGNKTGAIQKKKLQKTKSSFKHSTEHGNSICSPIN